MSADDISTITKDNPVYLYKLVLNSTYEPNQSYKELICVEAWPSNPNSYIFDYYYTGRLHHQQVPTSANYVDTKKRTFIAWLYERDDALVLEACKRWISDQIKERMDKIRHSAWTVIHDQNFLSTLTIKREGIKDNGKVWNR